MEYVKGITSDHELIKLADIIGVRLDDIIEINEIRKPSQVSKGSYLILLRSDNGVGHWTAVCNGSYFDSTGIGPPRKVGNLPYSEVQYQSTYAEYCGVWCLLWLYSKQKDKPELMHGFANLDIDVID